MHVPVDIQVWRLSVLALVGVGADLLFQFYRAFRSVFRPKKFGYHLLDVLVALATVGAIAFVTFLVNRGEMRMYVPASLAVGFLVSNMLVGSVAYRASRGLFLQVRRGMHWTRRHTVDPARKALRSGKEWLRQAMARIDAVEEPGGPPPPEEPPSGPSDSASPPPIPPQGFK